MDFKGKDGDRINLAAVDANAALPGHQTLVFHGQTAGSHGVWYQAEGNGSTLLFADVDGDARADFSVSFLGVESLSHTDLVLQ